jgi:hypothetical protein
LSLLSCIIASLLPVHASCSCGHSTSMVPQSACSLAKTCSCIAV